EQRVAENVELALQRRSIFGNVQRQVDRAPVGGVELRDAKAEQVYRRTAAGDQIECRLARFQACVKRQVLVERRRRAPVVLLAALDIGRAGGAGVGGGGGLVQARVRGDGGG